MRAYRRQQEIWDAAGGRWTPYGREERKEPEAPYKAVGEKGSGGVGETRGRGDGETRGRGDAEKEKEKDSWITGREAARILGLCAGYVCQLGLSGKLVRRARPKSKGCAILYRMDSVLRLAGRRESESWRRGISPKDWNHDLRRPIIRTKIEAPPGDRLISAQEAADLLEVTRHTVFKHVASGRLFGWQSTPGRQGCKLYLSERQVLRYAEDPQRLKYRDCWKGEPSPEWLKTGDDHEAWMESHGLAGKVGFGRELERGEFVTTSQAARTMGVTRSAVRAMRARGTLKGYRSERSKGGAGAWWFFLRDDVLERLWRRRSREHGLKG